MLWLAVIAAIAASRDDRYIAINLAERLLPDRVRRPVNALVELFTATVAGLLAWHALSFVRDSLAFGDVLLGNWPAWIFQSILPIGFALLCYRYALRFLSRFMPQPREEPG